MIPALRILFLLATTTASALAAAPQPMINNIRFGVVREVSAGIFEFVQETKQIPYRLKSTGFRFGITFDNPRRELIEWYEVVHFPAEPVNSSGNFERARSRTMKTTPTRSSQPTVIEDFWFDEGDPIGPHRMELIVNGVVRYAADFVVENAEKMPPKSASEQPRPGIPSGPAPPACPPSVTFPGNSYGDLWTATYVNGQVEVWNHHAKYSHSPSTLEQAVADFGQYPERSAGLDWAQCYVRAMQSRGIQTADPKGRQAALASEEARADRQATVAAAPRVAAATATANSTRPATNGSSSYENCKCGPEYLSCLTRNAQRAGGSVTTSQVGSEMRIGIRDNKGAAMSAQSWDSRTGKCEGVNR